MKYQVATREPSVWSLRSLIIGVVVLVATIFATIHLARPASAMTPPDTCFAFSAGTITEYYDNEGNNPANPACPKNVDIPATIGGVTVTSITGPNAWSGAFQYKDLTAVTIPNTVTDIGLYAFLGNQLTSVVVPSSVTAIGDAAFGNNVKLTTVTIQGDPATIGANVLANDSIESITYNGTIYTSTTSSTVNPLCFAFSAGMITSFRNADLALIKSDGQACLHTRINIPSTIGGQPVTTIGNFSLAGRRFTSVTIPSSVTTIGAFSLYGNALTTIDIPSSVTTIDQYAFYYNQLRVVSIQGNPSINLPGAFYVQGITADPITGAYDLSGALITNLYAPNMTIPPSNTLSRESDPDEDFDYNQDGDKNDIIYGIIVNPTPLAVHYQDQQGNSIAPSRTIYGDGIADQLVSSLAAVNPSVTTADLASLYYFAGSSATQAPLAIAGYSAPGSQTRLMTTGQNEMTFVYTKIPTQGGTDAGAGSASTPNAPDSGVGSVTTGVVPLAIIAIILVGGAAALARSTRR